MQRGGDDRPNVNPTPNTNGNQNSQNGNSNNNQSKPSTPSNPGTPSQPANPSKPATPSTPSKPSNPTTPSKPSTPSTPSKPNTSASAQGGNAYDITGLSAYLNSATKTNISGDKDSVITIGNHKITVVRPGITAGKFLKVLDQKGNMTVSGDILSYVRFGTATVFTSSGAEEKTYEFAYSKLTPANDVPASGKATYKGYVHTETALAGYLNASLFNVDFCKKPLTKRFMIHLMWHLPRLMWLYPEKSAATRLAAQKARWRCRAISTARKRPSWAAFLKDKLIMARIMETILA